jgi:hypothetical protein
MIQAKPYGIICDPGPCDPGALVIFARDFGFGFLLLFAAAALVAGRKASRSNFALPALCVASIWAAVYLTYWQKMARVRQAYFAPPSLPRDKVYQWIEQARHETIQTYAIGFLVWALVPFGIGLLITVIQNRKNELSNA